MADLVARTTARLAGAPPAPSDHTLVTDRHRRLMERVKTLGRSVVVPEAPTVTVVALDRPGLLATVTGVLALRGLDVRSADIAGKTATPSRCSSSSPLEVGGPTGNLSPTSSRPPFVGRSRSKSGWRLRPAPMPEGDAPRAPAATTTTVTVDNSASASATVLELYTADAVGLLHRVTTSLFELDLDVTAARVSTLGHDVVDAFYIRDKATGGKVLNPDRIDDIERAVRAATRDASEMAGLSTENDQGEKTSGT